MRRKIAIEHAMEQSINLSFAMIRVEHANGRKNDDNPSALAIHRQNGPNSSVGWPYTLRLLLLSILSCIRRHSYLRCRPLPKGF